MSSFSYDPNTDVCYRILQFMNQPDYRVGDDGSVWSRKLRSGNQNWKRLADRPDSHGRNVVALSHRGIRISYFVSHLVLLAFIGTRPPNTECCHNDGDHTNNKPHNLRWGTHQSNMQDRGRHGKSSRMGETNGSAKLNQQLVLEIRQDHKTKNMGIWKYARAFHKKYNVNPSTIAAILKNETWKPQ
jgi:hypothetical protein